MKRITYVIFVIFATTMFLGATAYARTFAGNQINPSYYAICDVKALNSTHAEIIRCVAYGGYMFGGNCTNVAYMDSILPQGKIVSLPNNYEAGKTTRIGTLLYESAYFAGYEPIAVTADIISAAIERCEANLKELEKSARIRQTNNLLMLSAELFPAAAISLLLIRWRPQKSRAFLSASRVKIALAILLFFGGLFGIVPFFGTFTDAPLPFSPAIIYVSLVYTLLFLPLFIALISLSPLLSSIAPIGLLIFMLLHAFYAYFLACWFVNITYRLKTKGKNVGK